MVAISNHQSAMLTSAGEDKYVNVRLLFISHGFGLVEIPFCGRAKIEFLVPGIAGHDLSLLQKFPPCPCKLQPHGQRCKGAAPWFLHRCAPHIHQSLLEKKEPRRTEM